jgi:hypothetical protein
MNTFLRSSYLNINSTSCYLFMTLPYVDVYFKLGKYELSSMELNKTKLIKTNVF